MGYTNSPKLHWGTDTLWYRDISQPSGGLALSACFRQSFCLVRVLLPPQRYFAVVTTISGGQNAASGLLKNVGSGDFYQILNSSELPNKWTKIKRNHCEWLKHRPFNLCAYISRYALIYLPAKYHIAVMCVLNISFLISSKPSANAVYMSPVGSGSVVVSVMTIDSCDWWLFCLK